MKKGDDEPQVLVQRWPRVGEYLPGPRVLVIPLERAAEALADSGFMHEWIVGKIAEELLAGTVFVNHGRTSHDYEPAIEPNGEQPDVKPRSQYSLARPDQIAAQVAKGISDQYAGVKYVLAYHEGPDLIAKYYALPEHAKAVLDALNETQEERFSFDEMVEYVDILVINQGRIRTSLSATQLVEKYKDRLAREGHLKQEK